MDTLAEDLHTQNEENHADFPSHARLLNSQQNTNQLAPFIGKSSTPGEHSAGYVRCRMLEEIKYGARGIQTLSSRIGVPAETIKNAERALSDMNLFTA